MLIDSFLRDNAVLDCLYPNQTTISSDNCIDIPGESKVVTIFDGSNYPNSDWKYHLHWALQVARLAEISTPLHCCLNFVNLETPLNYNKENQDDKRSVRISPKCLKQKGGYNCGPIVCLHAWEILSNGLFTAKNLEYKMY
jgi:hypothetical protein